MTWVQYRISVNIPDIDCERCSLQVSNPMTDKIPQNTTCTDPDGTCFSVYHSCANVAIMGTRPWDSNSPIEDLCRVDRSWPPANEGSETYLPKGEYGLESAEWDETAFLVGYGDDYRQNVGPCADVPTNPRPTVEEY